MKRYSARMQMLTEKYQDKIGDGLEFELDFSSNISVFTSDLLITDWSGIAIEFAFATLRPVLFINTKMKMENPNYEKIGIVPQEIQLRTELGTALEKDELAEKVRPAVSALLENDQFAEKLEKKRETYFYNLGSHGAEGAKYIIGRLVKKD